MKCRDCAEGRRFSAGAVNCLLYGMIIRENHECTRKGWKRRDEGEGQRGEGEGETEIRGTGGGAAEGVPEIL